MELEPGIYEECMWCAGTGEWVGTPTAGDAHPRPWPCGICDGTGLAPHDGSDDESVAA